MQSSVNRKSVIVGGIVIGTIITTIFATKYVLASRLQDIVEDKDSVVEIDGSLLSEKSILVSDLQSHTFFKGESGSSSVKEFIMTIESRGKVSTYRISRESRDSRLYNIDIGENIFFDIGYFTSDKFPYLE